MTSRGIREFAPLPVLGDTMELGSRWGSPTAALTMEQDIMDTSRVSSTPGPARHPAQAGYTGAPTPALAGSQPCHPSNHLHGSRTSLFLVESKRLFKDSLPTAAHLVPKARVTPSSSPRPALEVNSWPEDRVSFAGRVFLCHPFPRWPGISTSGCLPCSPSLRAEAWCTDSA